MLARALGSSLLWMLLGAVFVPPNVRVSMTDQSMLLLSDGRVLSTATVCPGFQFAQFGPRGPKLSPDQHWVLVDIIGPYAPGNVQRNHALVAVMTGKIVTSPDFPAYFGVPSTADALAWASGERATLRYQNGKTATMRDPPLQKIAERRCAPATPGSRP